VVVWLVVVAIFHNDTWMIVVPDGGATSGGQAIGSALRGVAGALVYATNWFDIFSLYGGRFPLGHLWSLTGTFMALAASLGCAEISWRVIESKAIAWENARAARARSSRRPPNRGWRPRHRDRCTDVGRPTRPHRVGRPAPVAW
jgi:peptidoglycan/LPS O-acetylase OafA/YrhL